MKLNIENAFGCEGLYVSKQSVSAYDSKVKECIKMLHDGSGKGNDFLGWLTLPGSITESFMDEIIATANDLRSRCDVVVVAGIGGSYLGARAVIDALSNSFAAYQKSKKNPAIVYAGNNISEDYLAELSAFFSAIPYQPSSVIV